MSRGGAERGTEVDVLKTVPAPTQVGDFIFKTKPPLWGKKLKKTAPIEAGHGGAPAGRLSIAIPISETFHQTDYVHPQL